MARRCARRPRAGTSASSIRYQGGHGSAAKPADEERRRDVVGQVGDDRASARRRARAMSTASASPATIVKPVRDSARRSRRAPRGSARRARSRPPAAPRRQAAPGSGPPGPGPTSITVTPARSPAARAMRAVRLRSRRKFWPSALTARRPWRAMTSRSGGSVVDLRSSRALRCASSSAASRSAAARLDGSALPLPAMSSAVPWSGDVRTKARPSVTLTVSANDERLRRDQRLVVIHAKRRVVAGARRRDGTWRRRRAARTRRCPRRCRACDRRPDDPLVLVAERAAFAGMRD